MSIAQSVLAVNDDLPIRTHLPVHSGKVRSVYWLTPEDSARLIEQKGYDVAPDAPLAVMVISDRISAFDCIWHAEGDVRGVPGKGAALNAISNHWFRLFKSSGLADSHILDIPHPFVWIVQKARPVMVEAICRAYITGSMWRAYDKGEREFCGIELPEGLTANQKLEELLITPSTKGVIKGVPGIPEADDVNVTRQQLLDHLSVFGFRNAADVDLYEQLLKQGFNVISDALARIDQLFVDTKFEFGYVRNRQGEEKLIYMDEVGTPDSSRMWDADQYAQGKIVENSKEGFRQFLLNHFSDPDIMLNKNRFDERLALARDNALPLQAFMDLSETYVSMAEKITGQPIVLSDNPKAEITQVLADRFGLIK